MFMKFMTHRTKTVNLFQLAAEKKTVIVVSVLLRQIHVWT